MPTSEPVMRRVSLAILVAFGCGSAPTPTRAPSTARIAPWQTWGTADPYEIVAMPPDARWAVICQARGDTNGDGKIAISFTMHGDQEGDAMTAYLVDPAGHESVIDNVLGHSTDGRWLAIVEAGAPVLIETTTWRRTPLDGSLPQFHITTGHASWDFSPDSRYLLFSRHGAPIVRELATGIERTIAPAAWRTDWSADGSWVELRILHGDTDHDGYVHGPDDEPSEGVPGNNCGYKHSWGDVLTDIDPDVYANDAAKLQAVSDSAQREDDLARVLWRVRDGRLVNGVMGISDSVIVGKRADGQLEVGELGKPAKAIPVGCEIQSSWAPANSLVLRCALPGDLYSVRWWRGDAELELYHGAYETVLIGENNAHVEIAAKATSIIVDSTDGHVISRREHTYISWQDRDRLLVHRDSEYGGSLIALYVHGKADPIVWTRELGAVEYPYAIIGDRRLDLRTLETVDVPPGALRMRSDGALLFDGGATTLDIYQASYLRRGPLRWVQP